MSHDLRIHVGEVVLEATWEDAAPRTVAFLQSQLPLAGMLRHARWSGEAVWVPCGDLGVDGLDFENATCYPAPGQLLFYAGTASEREILLPYGRCRFASDAGSLAGNHFATVRGGADLLAAIGRARLDEGGIGVVLTAG